MSKLARSLCLALIVFLSAGIATARPTVEIVAATQPGGPQDLAVRQFQKAITDIDPSRDYVVMYKPGAAGLIAYNYATKPTNNPTILVLAVGGVTEMMIQKGYDELKKEVQLIGPVWTGPGVLAVSHKSGINNLDDFVKQGRERKMTCGSVGPAIKMSLEYYAKMLKFKDTEVIMFKSTSEGLPMLVGGELDCWIDALHGPVGNLAESGRIKIIASSEDRAPQNLPNLPLMKSYLPAGTIFYYSYWVTLALPEANTAEFKRDITPLIDRAIRAMESTDTVKIQHPNQVDPQFFPRHATFVKKLTENVKK